MPKVVHVKKYYKIIYQGTACSASHRLSCATQSPPQFHYLFHLLLLPLLSKRSKLPHVGHPASIGGEKAGFTVGRCGVFLAAKRCIFLLKDDESPVLPRPAFSSALPRFLNFFFFCWAPLFTDFSCNLAVTRHSFRLVRSIFLQYFLGSLIIFYTCVFLTVAPRSYLLRFGSRFSLPLRKVAAKNFWLLLLCAYLDSKQYIPFVACFWPDLLISHVRSSAFFFFLSQDSINWRITTAM